MIFTFVVSVCGGAVGVAIGMGVLRVLRLSLKSRARKHQAWMLDTALNYLEFCGVKGISCEGIQRHLNANSSHAFQSAEVYKFWNELVRSETIQPGDPKLVKQRGNYCLTGSDLKDGDWKQLEQ